MAKHNLKSISTEEEDTNEHIFSMIQEECKAYPMFTWVYATWAIISRVSRNAGD
jgi:hypothetical protein